MRAIVVDKRRKSLGECIYHHYYLKDQLHCHLLDQHHTQYLSPNGHIKHGSQDFITSRLTSLPRPLHLYHSYT